MVDLPWGNVVHSGGVQLDQGAMVPEVAGSAPVKAFLVPEVVGSTPVKAFLAPVEAHQEKEFLEDLVL